MHDSGYSYRNWPSNWLARFSISLLLSVRFLQWRVHCQSILAPVPASKSIGGLSLNPRPEWLLGHKK